MKQKLYAYPIVRRSGMCNMLFPWARAVLFSHKWSCSVLAPQWTNYLRIGPWLRGECDKRYYMHQFTNAGYIKGLHKEIILLKYIGQKVDEKSASLNCPQTGIVTFRGLGCYFKELEGFSHLLKNELQKITNPQIVSRLNQLPEKFIGVHIRRGDFMVSGQELPFDYYYRSIDKARRLTSCDLPVLVFSDEKKDVLFNLAEYCGAIVMPKAPALYDMLALSKSSVLIGTNHSTFSEWAAFLGGQISIWDKNGRLPSRDFRSVFV